MPVIDTPLWVPPSYALANNGAGRPANQNPSQVVLNGPNGVSSTRPTRERVARTNSAWWVSYNRYLNKLPRPVDNLDREMLGLDIFNLMLQDPQIHSSVYLAAMASLSRGLRVKPRINDPKDPRYALSVKLQRFIEYNLDAIGEEVTELLQDMIVASLVYGNSVAEQTWFLKEGGEWDGKLILESIKPKSPTVYGFVVDPFGNVKGIAAFTAKDITDGLPKAVTDTTSRVIVDTAELPAGWEILPIEKFAVMTHRKRMGDPRGQSVLRAAYGAWHILMQLWPEYLKYLIQFASPSIVGVTPEKATVTTNVETGEQEDPVDVLYSELEGWQNGSILVVRYGTDIDVKWPTQGDGTVFINAINTLNHQMVKAILHQLLATEEGKHMARAAASTHQDVLNIAVRGIKNMTVSTIQNQIFYRLIKMNYGEATADMLTPIASLGDIAPEDKSAMLSSYADVGYVIGPTQFPDVDAELEMKVRTAEDAEKDYTKAAQAKINNNANAKKTSKPASKPANPATKPNMLTVAKERIKDGLEALRSITFEEE